MTQLDNSAALASLQVLVNEVEDQLGLAQLGLSLLRAQLAVQMKEATLDPTTTPDHPLTGKHSSPPPPSQNSGSLHEQHKHTGEPTKPSPSDWTNLPSTYSWSP
jgi:hypothetical protein